MVADSSHYFSFHLHAQNISYHDVDTCSERVCSMTTTPLPPATSKLFECQKRKILNPYVWCCVMRVCLGVTDRCVSEIVFGGFDAQASLLAAVRRGFLIVQERVSLPEQTSKAHRLLACAQGVIGGTHMKICSSHATVCKIEQQ